MFVQPAFVIVQPADLSLRKTLFPQNGKGYEDPDDIMHAMMGLAAIGGFLKIEATRNECILHLSNKRARARISNAKTAFLASDAFGQAPPETQQGIEEQLNFVLDVLSSKVAKQNAKTERQATVARLQGSAGARGMPGNDGATAGGKRKSAVASQVDAQFVANRVEDHAEQFQSDPLPEEPSVDAQRRNVEYDPSHLGDAEEQLGSADQNSAEMSPQQYKEGRANLRKDITAGLKNVVLPMLRKGDLQKQLSACEILVELMQQAAAATFVLIMQVR